MCQNICKRIAHSTFSPLPSEFLFHNVQQVRGYRGNSDIILNSDLVSRRQ